MRRRRVTRWLVALTTTLLVASACTQDPDERNLRPRRGSGESDRPKREWSKAACSLRVEIVRRIRRGFYPGRMPEVIAVPKEPNYFGGFVGTSHSGPWDYVQRVPMVFHGPGFIRPRGELSPDREATVADIAPTIAELIGTPFPDDRPGRAISEALPSEDERGAKPRLVVVVVWDGGGWDVLEAWPDAWPNLQRLMNEGTSVVNATVGSSPSNTPPIHTSIGTGAFPNQHGITDIDVRVGDRVVDAFEGGSPEHMEISTLADLYDLQTNNEAQIGMFGSSPWHFGMMSRGTFHSGGDKDVAVVIAPDGDGMVGSERFYEFPRYVNDLPGFEEAVREVDAEDGKIDGQWLGNDVLEDPFDIKRTPTWLKYQTSVMREIFEREGFGADDVPDLFYVNYKAPDLIGHAWNMLSQEVRSSIVNADRELGELTEILNGLVGRNRWVMAVTADHGQTPLPETTGAWPIFMTEVERDIGRRFDMDPKQVLQRTRPGHFWLNPDAVERGDVTADELADFLTSYRLTDNVSPERTPVPDRYESRLNERVFSAAFPSDAMEEVWDCVRRG